jgi:hypothetical protein
MRMIFYKKLKSLVYNQLKSKNLIPKIISIALNFKISKLNSINPKHFNNRFNNKKSLSQRIVKNFRVRKMISHLLEKKTKLKN